MKAAPSSTIDTSQFSPSDWHKLVQFYSILIEIAQDMQKAAKNNPQK